MKMYSMLTWRVQVTSASAVGVPSRRPDYEKRPRDVAVHIDQERLHNMAQDGRFNTR